MSVYVKSLIYFIGTFSPLNNIILNVHFIITLEGYKNLSQILQVI